MTTEKENDSLGEMNEPAPVYASAASKQQENTPGSEDRIKDYWLLLSEEQKEALVDMARRFVESGDVSSLSESQIESLLQQRERILQGTERTHTWDEVKTYFKQKYGARNV